MKKSPCLMAKSTTSAFVALTHPNLFIQAPLFIVRIIFLVIKIPFWLIKPPFFPEGNHHVRCLIYSKPSFFMLKP